MSTPIRQILFFNAACIVFGAAFLLFSAPIFYPTLSVYLRAESTPLRNADVAVVLGGGYHDRVDGGIRLYKEKKVQAILMSGGTDSWNVIAQDMKDYAVSKGVPSASVFTEARSKSTIENAEFSKEVLLKMNVSRIIVVTSESHSRRAFLTFKKSLKNTEITVQIYPTQDDNQLKAFLKDHESMETIMMEWSKLLIYFAKGFI